MKLLVVGATGTLGRQIARRALDENHEVRCLVRNFGKASFLREWGAQLMRGNLCDPESLAPALEGIDAVIDVATARATDSLRVQQVDWEGKVNLIQAVEQAGIDRYIFFSMINAEKYPEVPLMKIKHCTELLLEQSKLNYTVFRLSGFMQGLIGQYAIPMLDNQAVWLSGEDTPVAYMNTQDIAKFVTKSLTLPQETGRKIIPLAGTKAWGGEELIKVCEQLSGKTPKVSRMSLQVLRFMRQLTRFFGWSLNASDRLAFAEVMAGGKPIKAEMEDTYNLFAIDPKELTSVEGYLGEYFNRIMKKLKELDYEQEKNKRLKEKKKKIPF
ncbi:MAG: NmrA family NAD(P)-binding protein [Synechococcaceae cyanobacterium RL_1_2]|nr:NmrA family NAD(P)-binding protein [Synechococcaceae cyanobacterium RL_1_2]